MIVCMHTIFENGVTNEAIVLQWLVQTASWDFKVVKKRSVGVLLSVNSAVLCEIHRERVTQFWTSPSEDEERKKNILAICRLSGLVLLQCFFASVGIFFIMKTLKDEPYVVIKAYKFTAFEILRVFSCIIIYCVSALSLRIQSTDSITHQS